MSQTQRPAGAVQIGWFNLRTLRIEPLEEPARRAMKRRPQQMDDDTIKITGINTDQRGAVENMVPTAWIAARTATTVTFRKQPPGVDGGIAAGLERLIGARKSLDGTVNPGRGYPIQPLQSVLRKVKRALA